MSAADLAALVTETLLVTFKLAGPILLASLVVGLVVSVLQAATQIHEATLAFIPKAIIIGITIVLMTPFMMATINSFTHHLFDHIVLLGAS